MRYILLITLFFGSIASSFAQDIKVTNDLLTWYGLGLNKEITKSLQLDIEKEFRLNNNGTELYKHLTYTNLYYEPLNHFYFGLALKFIRDKNKQDVFEDEYTHIVQAMYKNKLNQFEYALRTRFEQNTNKLFQLQNNEESSYTIRQKIKVGYKLNNSDFKPYIGSELFYNNSSDESGLDKIRFDVGTNYKINPNNKVKVYYRIERELTKDNPYTFFNIGVFYTHSF